MTGTTTWSSIVAVAHTAGPTLVGRESAWARLAESAGQAADGVPTVAVVQGEAGIGKSRLVSDWSADARDTGSLVAFGRCVEFEGAALPLAPVAGVLRDLARQLGPASLAGLAGPEWAVLTGLVPELGSATSLAAASSQRRLFDAVAGLLRRLAADQPVVVIVEDVHWSDPSTRDLVGYLARVLRDERLLVVLTIRTEISSAVEGFLAELVRLPAADRIELPRLEPDQVGPSSRTLWPGTICRTGGRDRAALRWCAIPGRGAGRRRPSRQP